MREFDKLKVKNNLVYQREKNGLTQADTANALGLSRRQFNHLENNPEAIKAGVLADLAKLYLCSITDFFKI